MQDFAQFCILLSGRTAPDRQHALDAGIEQAFAQHTLPDHAGGAEQDDFHPISPAALHIQAAAATWANDTPVSVAETSQSRAATAASFAPRHDPGRRRRTLSS